MRLAALFLCAALALPCPATAAEFFVDMQACKTTVALLGPGEKDLRVSEAQTQFLRCAPSGRELRCDITHRAAAATDRESGVVFAIVEDAPPILRLMREERTGQALVSTRMQVNTRTGAAVSVTELLDPAFASAMTCRGVYLTEQEMRLLQKLTK